MSEEPVHRPQQVDLDPAVAVLVTVAGEQWPGWALAYRGDRVYASWSKGPGLNHLAWVDAADVTRT